MIPALSPHPHHDGTMLDIVRAHARQQPDHPAYAYLPELETGVVERLDYAGLMGRADAVAAALDRHFATRPDQPRMALLLFPAGLDFLVAFWGCLAGRVIAIPAAMPRPGRPATTLGALAENAGVGLILTATGQGEAIGRLMAATPALAGLDLLSVDELVALGTGRPVPAAPVGEDIAFLQYTSGSTSRPKGVVVRHRNLRANGLMIAEAMAMDRHLIGVNWMPHYHDMGLIGNLLQPLHVGGTALTMAPTTFLKRPIRWLRAISDARAVLAGGPDFAYRLCVERISAEDAAGLDLSCWKIAFNGAEPVRATTIQGFCDHFAVAGFRPHSMYPCYGMAEVTLLAGGSRAGQGATLRTIAADALAQGRAIPPAPGQPSLTAVCSGWAPTGARLAVVDPATKHRCPDGTVGEIWVAGPHVADGYHNDPAATAAAFGARITGPQADPGPWLRTGDLGYLLDGGIQVTGRLKEMMIVNGRNLYPHDVEDALRAALAEIRDAAVFAMVMPEGAGEGRERCVAVLELASSHRKLILQPDGETETSLQALARAARTVAAQSCELPLDHVRIALPGAILKTTSGKTRYGELRAQMLLLGDMIGKSPLSVGERRPRQEEA